MLSKAYLHFSIDEEIDSNRNRFTLDGSGNFPIPGRSTDYKLPAGEHTIVITSGAGDEWTIRTIFHPKQRVKVKLSLQQGDVSDVMYKPSPASFSTFLLAKKLPLKR
jgi:hypothetical protein